jgi:SAM-dependent methyltransferase
VYGFESAYRSGTPPWDIGQPQPAVVRLAEQFAFTGRVLDIGCGTGENAMFLASRGLDVTGLDAAPTAIERARAKAAARGLKTRFEVADALDLGQAGLGGPYDSVLDCGLFHTFGDADRPRFERSLRRVLAPGARYYILCFSNLEPGDMGPRHIRKSEIEATFAHGWRIDSIEETRFATLWGGEGPRAWLASLTLLDPQAETPGSSAAASRPPAYR